MIITFLGTGTSQGVPVIGCTCPVCTSSDPRDQRLRTSLHLALEGRSYVIDIGPDFRQQMLRTNIDHLDGILLTHEHNDHVSGLDDVRPYNFRQGVDMPIYGTSHVLKELQVRFAYAFEAEPYPGSPRLALQPIDSERPFSLNGIDVQPIPVWHGRLPVLGFRIGDFTYITDAKTIPESSRALIRGSRVLVLNALRQKPHYSHFHLAEALEVAADLGAEHTYLTHASHLLGSYREIAQTLPAGVSLAYDGLQVTV